MGRKRKLGPGSSKWLKYKSVASVGSLARHLPETRIYSPEAVRKLLNRYPSVFVKPDRGYGGSHVMQVKKQGNRLLALHRHRQHLFSDEKEFDRWLKSIRKKRRFLVQQGIELAPYHGRPVDVRTIVQKNRLGTWTVTGMFAKAAKRGMVVTNVKAGGRVFPLGQYLKEIGMSSPSRKKTIASMKRWSKRCARGLNRRFANRTYGLDLGLDRKQKLWLIEVNTHPSFNILKKISMRMYRQAIRLRRRS